MITKVFAVWDSKAQMYNAPFFGPAVGSAVRSFADASNDPQMMISRHPDDYILYQIGEFDDNSGELKSVIPPLHLGKGSDFVVKKSPVGVGPVVMSSPEVSNGSEAS